jgi:hypothetical protein
MKTPLFDLLLRFARCSSGSALVEATIVLPVAIILMAGGIEFGIAYSASSTADKSMRDATRYLARVPQSAVCGWGLNKAKNLAVYGNTAGTGDPLIPNWSTSNITLAQPSDCTTSFSIIQLTATVPFTAPSQLLSWIGLPNSLTIINIQHEERWISE